MRLVRAHIDLAKAEANAIKGELIRAVALAGLALGVTLLAIILLVVGLSLFLGEWLLGSLGWGVLHGTLLLFGIAIACGIAAVGVDGGRIGRSFVVGVIAAVVVGVVMALGLPNEAYTRVGEASLPGIEPGIRPLLVGAIIVGVIGLVLGLIVAIRGRDGGFRFGALIGGLIAGALLGAISSADLGVQVGAGIGIAFGYIVWLVMMIADVARSGIDTESLKARFYPTQTIETSKETLAWLQSKMPPGIGS